MPYFTIAVVTSNRGPVGTAAGTQWLSAQFTLLLQKTTPLATFSPLHSGPRAPRTAAAPAGSCGYSGAHLCTSLQQAGSINGHSVKKNPQFLYEIMITQPRHAILPHSLRDQAFHMYLRLILWALLQCHNENKIMAFKCSYWDNHIQPETTRKPKSSNPWFTVKQLMLTGRIPDHILYCWINSMLHNSVPSGRPIFCY